MFRDSRQVAATDRGAVLTGFRQVWTLDSVLRLRYWAALTGLHELKVSSYGKWWRCSSCFVVVLGRFARPPNLLAFSGLSLAHSVGLTQK